MSCPPLVYAYLGLMVAAALLGLAAVLYLGWQEWGAWWRLLLRRKP